MDIRLANLNDLPAISHLMSSAMKALSSGFYNELETASAVRYIAIPDAEIVKDGTYYVALKGEKIVACGGWSARKKLFTGTTEQTTVSGWLNPDIDSARIRAMFVDPNHARQGLGRLILQTCEDAASHSGFRSFELMATLPGLPLYQACGYREIEKAVLKLPDGTCLDAILMRRALLPQAGPYAPNR